MIDGQFLAGYIRIIPDKRRLIQDSPLRLLQMILHPGGEEQVAFREGYSPSEYHLLLASMHMESSVTLHWMRILDIILKRSGSKFYFVTAISCMSLWNMQVQFHILIVHRKKTMK